MGRIEVVSRRVGALYLFDILPSSLISKERNHHSPIKLKITLVLLDVKDETTLKDEVDVYKRQVLLRWYFTE